jgi:hypothetical protein
VCIFTSFENVFWGEIFRQRMKSFKCAGVPTLYLSALGEVLPLSILFSYMSNEKMEKSGKNNLSGKG